MFTIEKRSGGNRRVEYHLCIKCCRMINISEERYVVYSEGCMVFYHHQECPPNNKKQKLEFCKI